MSRGHIICLSAGQFLPGHRTARALVELSGISLSSGTAAGITARAAARLGGSPEHPREQIAASKAAGPDETGSACTAGRTGRTAPGTGTRG
jgi:hypothetical protein